MSPEAVLYGLCYQCIVRKNYEKDYQTKDIKATKTKGSSEIREEKDGLFYFDYDGETHGFTKHENAEIALNRLKGE